MESDATSFMQSSSIIFVKYGRYHYDLLEECVVVNHNNIVVSSKMDIQPNQYLYQILKYLHAYAFIAKLKNHIFG